MRFERRAREPRASSMGPGLALAARTWVQGMSKQKMGGREFGCFFYRDNILMKNIQVSKQHWKNKIK